MSGYVYAPPPPPPSASGGHPGYGQPNLSYPHHGHARGGGGAPNGRGRGGQYSRGRSDYHAAPAPAPQAHFEYAAQPYPPHNQAPYGASSLHSAVTYQPHPQQWAPEHGHVPAPPNAHPHAPAPISPANYHPNYAPQLYPPSQYSQQPSYGPPQQYGNPYQHPPQPAASHWGHQGAPQQGHYASGRGGRGGYNDRGGSKHPHMGAPFRQGYEHEPVAAVGASFGQPYPHDPRASHYPLAQYPYSGPPAAPAPLHQEVHHGGQYHRRGRGGGHRDGVRGRGGHHHGGDRARNHQHQHQKQSHGGESKMKTESALVGKKKKRKTNTLGLTPGMESESEDDEGEEKALVDLIGAETLQISDIAAFLTERRKNFPTKARVEAKKAAELARKDEDKAASLEKQADKLRKQLRKVESSIKRKREQGDEGDEMRDPSEASSDDEKPEVMSSRTETTAPPPPPPAKKADVSRHCKYYATGGTCGKKGKCRFVHDPEVREAAMKERQANDGRITIQQRLILNDKEQEDLTILQSIQYLREKGAMKPIAKHEGVDAMDVDGKEESYKRKKPASGSSLLPAAPASLPEPPIKREAGTSRRNPPPSVIPTANSVSSQGLEHYQGWLLQPYGSTNGKQSKSDDLP
ncbi:Uncharacterized protein TCAP_00881 [Tolypocladium capitatum]|uniref:C3H1-type domain-containing protein n=1 Tax=Tolypocladium capitatum TaxID=45235 RepID=A0A2K3QNT6_9HYPO|nr:Uncharacterized protein TCAP_00881 [Tolypocladium capitatum]